MLCEILPMFRRKEWEEKEKKEREKKSRSSRLHVRFYDQGHELIHNLLKETEISISTLYYFTYRIIRMIIILLSHIIN